MNLGAGLIPVWFPVGYQIGFTVLATSVGSSFALYRTRSSFHFSFASYPLGACISDGFSFSFATSGAYQLGFSLVSALHISLGSVLVSTSQPLYACQVGFSSDFIAPKDARCQVRFKSSVWGGGLSIMGGNQWRPAADSDS